MNQLLFIKFTWTDAVDILLVSILLYQLYKLVKGSIAINIFAGILTFYLLWLTVRGLHMELLSTILSQFIGVGFIALIIVFQQEIRKFLLVVGSNEFFGRSNFIRRFFKLKIQPRSGLIPEVNSIVKACKNMAETKTGAIIVISTKSDLQFYANTGAYIDSRISSRLIETIFYKNSPLHDGAILISGNRIIAARCVLPVTDNTDFPVHLGMRHRAAVGVTESSDALAVLVSEQTGSISYSIGGKLNYDITPEQLTTLLEQAMAL